LEVFKTLEVSKIKNTMHSTKQTSTELRKPGIPDILELRKNEIEYWRVLYRRIPGSALSPGVRETVPFCTFSMPGINILAFNRVLIRPGNDNPGIDPASCLDGIIRYYRASAVPRFFLQLIDPVDSPAFRDKLHEKGFLHYNDWTRLSRPAELPPGETRGYLTIKRIDEKMAGAYGEIIVRSFDFPDVLIPHFSSTVGLPGFHHYLVYDNNEAIAAGALFIRNGYASMAIAGTLPEHRGKGAQQELLRERILQARNAGCRWITAETSRESPEKKVVSFRNMLRSGFRITNYRPNFIFYP
jgi:hypothetical protein